MCTYLPHWSPAECWPIHSNPLPLRPCSNPRASCVTEDVNAAVTLH